MHQACRCLDSHFREVVRLQGGLVVWQRRVVAGAAVIDNPCQGRQHAQSMPSARYVSRVRCTSSRNTQRSLVDGYAGGERDALLDALALEQLGDSTTKNRHQNHQTLDQGDTLRRLMTRASQSRSLVDVVVANQTQIDYLGSGLHSCYDCCECVCVEKASR